MKFNEDGFSVLDFIDVKVAKIYDHVHVSSFVNAADILRIMMAFALPMNYSGVCSLLTNVDV